MGAVAFFITLIACSGEVDLGPGIAARIDGRDIPYSDFADFLADTAGDSMDLQSVAIASLFESFLEEELLFAAALDRDLLTPGADRAIAGSLLLSSMDGLEASGQDIEAYYREHGAEFELGERVRIQQILVQEKGLLDQARAQLESGVPWPDVAGRLEREHGALVGSQGVLSRAEMPTAFVDAVFALDAGEITQVLKAEYGYHLFLVEERSPAGVVPLEQVRDDIARRIVTERSDRALEELLREAQERYNVLVADRNLPFERSGS